MSETKVAAICAALVGCMAVAVAAGPFVMLSGLGSCVLASLAARGLYKALPMRKREALSAGFTDYITGQPILRKKHIECLQRIAVLEKWHKEFDLGLDYADGDYPAAIEHADAPTYSQTMRSMFQVQKKSYDLGTALKTQMMGVTGATGPTTPYYSNGAEMLKCDCCQQHTLTREQWSRDGMRYPPLCVRCQRDCLPKAADYGGTVVAPIPRQMLERAQVHGEVGF